MGLYINPGRFIYLAVLITKNQHQFKIVLWFLSLKNRKKILVFFWTSFVFISWHLKWVLPKSCSLKKIPHSLVLYLFLHRASNYYPIFTSLSNILVIGCIFISFNYTIISLILYENSVLKTKVIVVFANRVPMFTQISFCIEILNMF